MSRVRPIVFLETHLLEATEERLVLKIPRRLPGWWTIVWAAACALAAPAVLLFLKGTGAPSNWLAGTAIVGGGMVILPWNWMQGIAFGWSRLRPASGRLELERSKAGDFSLRVGQEAEETSPRRGLFYLDLQGICTLVLVVGRRVVSVAYYLQTGGSGVNWPKIGEWDKGRAELARGARELEEPWAPRSVVPLVQAFLRVLDLGPQPSVPSNSWLGVKPFVVWFASWIALGGLHVASLFWLMDHASPFEAWGPIGGGLLMGAILLVPDAWLFTRHVKSVWIDPLNRKADEMLACAQGQ